MATDSVSTCLSKTSGSQRRSWPWRRPKASDHARTGDCAGVRRKADQASTTTGILPMRDCHSRGPVLCTDSPLESTATVTGMSLTSNS